MGKLQKILTISLALLAVQHLHSIDTAAVENQSEWLTESNDKYIYNKSATSKPAKSMFSLFNKQVEKSEDIKVSQHVFDTGITRTKTTIKPIDNLIQTTVETWITIDPSYLTWLNGALAAGALMNIPMKYIPQAPMQYTPEGSFKEPIINMPRNTLGKFQMLGSIPKLALDVYNANNEIADRQKNDLLFQNKALELEKNPGYPSYFKDEIWNNHIMKTKNDEKIQHLKWDSDFFTKSITNVSYNFVTDPIIATLLASGAAYYLYLQYLKYQESEQAKKTADLEKEIKEVEKLEQNQKE